jgi:hypothetical protein
MYTIQFLNIMVTEAVTRTHGVRGSGCFRFSTLKKKQGFNIRNLMAMATPSLVSLLNNVFIYYSFEI